MALLHLCAHSFFFKMLTLYELMEIVGNDKKLSNWMEKYNMATSCTDCHSDHLTMLRPLPCLHT